MKFLLLLAAALVAFGAPPAKTSTPNRQIRVPVSAGAEALLSVKDFEAVVEGAGAAKVIRVQSPKDDLLLMIVLDLTEDLAYADPARYALIEELRQIPANMRVALFRAQDGPQVLHDPTASPELIEKTLNGLAVTGKAALLDTLPTTVQLADSIAAKAAVRLAVLYVTDSDVRNYREDFTNPVINSSDSRDLSRKFPEGLIRERISKLEQTLVRHQAPVHVVHVRYLNERLNEAYQNGLMQLALATGGTGIFCRSTSEIPRAIASALSNITGQYSVTLQVPAKAPRTLNVALTSPDRQLSYRTRYVLR